jgi:hypothetical protein
LLQMKTTTAAKPDDICCKTYPRCYKDTLHLAVYAANPTPSERRSLSLILQMQSTPGHRHIKRVLCSPAIVSANVGSQSCKAYSRPELQTTFVKAASVQCCDAPWLLLSEEQCRHKLW